PFDTPVTAYAPSGARVWLVLDSGEREQVDSVLVLGRAPGTAAAGERAVTVADPTRSLSRTHLRIGPDGDGVWVEDAFSANGTSARTAVGEEIVLERGVRRHLDAGAVLVLGERSITVVREGVSRH
ncbi:MAG: hypothetical protein L0J79_08640, partial [Propionibacterium sp.]|nr:hypothetical protein [Propionibacterium sp.]